MIQVGGIGFMTVAFTVAFFKNRRIGLKERELMQESVAAPQIGGIVKLAKMIIIGTLIFEGAGALLLSFRFVPEKGFFSGVFSAIFHAVSAFCNAGFDLMGYKGEYSSLTSYSGDWYVNIIIMLLIIIGGIGFYVWSDLKENKFHFKKYSIHTKLVLTVTAILIIIPAIMIFLIEKYDAGVLSNTPLSEALASSLFQSVTTRTAGFNTLPVASLSDAVILVLMMLMLIGGSPGSTAGGIKTTTFAVLVMSINAVMKKRENPECFKRRLEPDILKKAAAILIVYMALIIAGTMILCITDDIPLKESLFEVFSAINTVGLSLGATAKLGVISKIVIALLMYFGRIGCLSIVMALSATYLPPPISYPLGKVAIG